MTSGKLTGAAVAQHNSKDSCWVIVHGKAYDVTEFLPGRQPRTLITATVSNSP
jgi:cytochrome b involved in lipid metabolism